jgi:hypothetical protein
MIGNGIWPGWGVGGERTWEKVTQWPPYRMPTQRLSFEPSSDVVVEKRVLNFILPTCGF